MHHGSRRRRKAMNSKFTGKWLYGTDTQIRIFLRGRREFTKYTPISRATCIIDGKCNIILIHQNLFWLMTWYPCVSNVIAIILVFWKAPGSCFFCPLTFSIHGNFYCFPFLPDGLTFPDCYVPADYDPINGTTHPFQSLILAASPWLHRLRETPPRPNLFVQHSPPNPSALPAFQELLFFLEKGKKSSTGFAMYFISVFRFLHASCLLFFRLLLLLWAIRFTLSLALLCFQCYGGRCLFWGSVWLYISMDG